MGRRILVTGAAGFVGAALARELLASLGEHDTLLLTDLAFPTEPCVEGDRRIRWLTGDLADLRFRALLFEQPVDAVVHLAGLVSGAAETEFDRGWRVNVDTTRAVLETCARQARCDGRAPRVIYASSIAVHGVPLPHRINDHTPPSPSLSYGAHKLIGELLLSELSRRAWVDGMSLRLAGVVVRPAWPNGALSGFNSDLIRETLAGHRVTSPVSPEAVIWLQSLSSAVGAIVKVLAMTGPAPDGARVVQLPAIAASIAEILAVISQVCGRDAWQLVDFRPDPAIEPMFGRWPRDHDFARALAMGLPGDSSLQALIADAATSVGPLARA